MFQADQNPGELNRLGVAPDDSCLPKHTGGWARCDRLVRSGLGRAPLSLAAVIRTCAPLSGEKGGQHRPRGNDLGVARIRKMMRGAQEYAA